MIKYLYLLLILLPSICSGEDYFRIKYVPAQTTKATEVLDTFLRPGTNKKQRAEVQETLLGPEKKYSGERFKAGKEYYIFLPSSQVDPKKLKQYFVEHNRSKQKAAEKPITPVTPDAPEDMGPWYYAVMAGFHLEEISATTDESNYDYSKAISRVQLSRADLWQGIHADVFLSQGSVAALRDYGFGVYYETNFPNFQAHNLTLYFGAKYQDIVLYLKSEVNDSAENENAQIFYLGGEAAYAVPAELRFAKQSRVRPYYYQSTSGNLLGVKFSTNVLKRVRLVLDAGQRNHKNESSSISSASIIVAGVELSF